MNNKKKKYQDGGKLNFYQQLLAKYAEEKGVSPEDIDREIERIAYHESKGDYGVESKISRDKGGLQFKAGKNQGAHTAINRLRQAADKYGLEVPLDYDNVGEDYNVSGLHPDLQKAMFLGDSRMRPKADFSQVVRGEMPAVDYWGKYHQTESDPKKMANFERDSAAFDKLPKGALGMSLAMKDGLPEKNFGGVLEAVGGSSNPYIAGAQAALKVGQLMKSTLDNKKALESAMIPDVQQVRNPFLKNGGKIKSDNIAVGPSHDQGGIPVNEDGEFDTANPVAEIEGNEPVNTYTQLPDKKGETYVLPTKYKGTVEKLNKKFKDSDFSDLDLAAKEFELSRLENKNERAKFMSMTAQMENEEGLPMGEYGLNIDAGRNILNPFAKKIDPIPTLDVPKAPTLEFKVESDKVNPKLTLDDMRSVPSAPKGKVQSSFMDKLSNIQDAKSLFEGVAALSGTASTPRIYNDEVGTSKQLIKETLKSDLSAQQEEVQRGLATGLANLRNGIRSGGAFAANAAQAAVSSAQNAAKLKVQQEQILNDRKSRAAQLLPNLEEINRREEIRGQVADQQNMAASMNVIGKQFQDYLNLEKTGENLLNHQKNMVTSLTAIDAQNPDIGLGPLIQALQSARTSEEISAAIKNHPILRYKKPK